MPTQFAEIIFEPGSKSVIQFDDEQELKDFLTEHVRRAKAGEDGGPAGHSAERVTKVFTYDKHPADWNIGKLVNAQALAALVDGMKNSDGWVESDRLVAAIRDETSPIFPMDQGKHESMYKLEGKPFDLSFLEGEN